MKTPLPFRPNADQVRKRAKDLLRAAHSGDDGAVRRIRDGNPRTDADRELALRDAQWTIVREHGFESWPKLVSAVDAISRKQRDVQSLDPPELVELLRVQQCRVYNAVKVRLYQTRAESTRALLAGLSHPNPKAPRVCGGDGRGGRRPLRGASARRPARPGTRVRRAALHSLMCQHCKDEPLRCDVVPDLIAALDDPNEKMRWQAVGGMGGVSPDVRLIPVLEQVLTEHDDPKLLRMAEGRLRIHLRALPLDRLIERARNGATLPIRQAAISALAIRPSDVRAFRALDEIARNETDPLFSRVVSRARQVHHGTEREPAS